MRFKTPLLALLTILLLATAGAVPQDDAPYEKLKAQAEKEYAEKSFSRARTLYEQAAGMQLPEEERRWVAFRLADTAWRADAAAPDRSPGDRETALKALQALIDGAVDTRLEAEVSESIGDFYATHPYLRNPGAAQGFYLNALDYWAGQDDLSLARRRYLAIVWKMSAEDPYHGLPEQVLVNAVKIAETPEDRARARILLAVRLQNTRTAANAERALELLDEIIREGRKTEWYDNALFAYATALAHRGEIDPELGPDYVRALELYRRLVSEFKPGESEYRQEAQNAIREITAVSVDVGVESTFLPRSQQEVVLSWRNVRQIELALYAVNLTEDAALDTRGDWKDLISLEGAPVIRSWTHETNTAEYHPGYERLRVNPKLPEGAYVITARAGGKSGRELILVSDTHITVYTGRNRLQAFVSHVETGEPIANARVRAWVTHYGQNQPTSKVDGQTDANGLVTIAVPHDGAMLIAATAGARQAYHHTYANHYGRGTREDQWRIYAFTDRPAYRPNETVQWKILARIRDEERWTTPTGALTYEITGPRGEKVGSGTAKLNAFGSFWSELALTPEMALGMYTITFKTAERHAGSAQLFRLEEYKLPEFMVRVSTPEGTQYRLGETIEATIDATYYFGGPVANAEVEAVVYQAPFYRYWYPWRVYDWYWRDFAPRMHESVMTTQTLRTDANGRAILRIDTPRDGTDMSYRIEARVVDASRREVRGSGTVRVTRQRYSVMAQPEHYIHRPGDPVSVKFRAVDANDKPVRTTGTVTVVRRRWSDRERSYADEDVLTTKLDTDEKGEATLTFTPKTTGYYAVRWVSIDGDPKRARDRVITETTLWVTDRTTTDIGYHHARGIDLIVDKEALRSGETAAVMVVAPASGRWVVLTSSGDDIFETRVLHLQGTVQLVQIPVDDRHIPNFFLTASSVFDRELSVDNERVVVPPDAHFLTVDVKADREEYEPRQEGTLTITTRNSEGKPVPAEVAVSVSDEAVTAIQTDPAGDPRPFFYGETRGSIVQVSGSVHTQRYVDLQEKELQERDARMREEKLGAKERRRDGDFVQGGVIGGIVSDAVAESITVTAAAAPMRNAMNVAPPPPPAPAAPPAVAQGADAPLVEVQVRSDFRSTAFWKPDVVTGADGTATVQVKFPESLTTWRATARAATTGADFGMTSTTARTNLPLLVRLQAPRFFVVGDRSTVSAVVNNNTGEAITVTPSLEVEGLTAEPASTPIVVPAHGDARADWTVTAERAGNAKIRVSARGTRFGDAMERTFVVYEHGIDKLIARSGKLRGSEALVRLELPRERRSTELTVQVTPSIAVTMLDALPYLVEFPYGCTEQTMSRFLPAAIVARTLRQRGLDPDARLPQKQLGAVTAAGMARLYDMQHDSGAWGWWHEGPDDAFMTAYVVWGFALARDGGLPVDTARVDRAAEWLEKHLVETKEQYNEDAWTLHALSAWRKPSALTRRAFDDVWEHRERLTPYSRALFALVAHRYGLKEQAAVLVRNLEDGVKIDRAPDQSVLLKGETAAETMATAHWGSDRFWWRWYEGPVETTAFALQALATIDPGNKLIEPAMNWLVKNRTGTRWSNTRDTAIVLLVMNDYLTRTGELSGGVSYELSVNGKVIATKTITAAEALREPPKFTIDPAVLTDTTQEIRIRRTGGTGPIYFSAEARFFSLEEPVKAAGNEIFVRREYFRFKPRPTLLKGVLYDKIPLRNGESIASGERVEVVVTVETKNDYEYLIFEDLKPAGFEAVELQSGQALYATGPRGSAWVYQELRDRKVAMFVDRLAQGVWEIRYVLRAETPGTFHALPLLGHAMYAPHIRANGDEVKVTVTEE